LAVYSVVLAGWSSGSKYPLLGGVRASAQMISYEAAMGLSLVPVILYSGSMSMSKIVESQSGYLSSPIPIVDSIIGFIPNWNIFPQFLAFGIFFIASIAEVNRAPFDLVEAEQELVGGFHTEYSGFRFAMFFLAEYINMFNMCAITATFFLGGWLGPTFAGVLPPFLSAIMPTIWLGVKTFGLLFVYFWIRATLPRLRYDQLMELGWKRLIPLSIIWLMISSIVLGIREFGLPWS
jgi:NADH-quinone oxidoreductase subunit H